MKALALVPGTTALRLIDRPEPAVTTPDQVKVQTVQVGICGTDREEAAGGRADAPPGRQELVIGHEMIGRVVDAGAAVTSIRPGDFVVFTVRRGCGRCPACAAGRSDMCYTGDYAERGIKGLDGYQAEFVVDSEMYAVKVPAALAGVGVLTEPLSVAEKAIDEAARVQVARLPDAGDATGWLAGKRVLVAGLGPIGLLAAIALRLRGADVVGLDVVAPESTRPRLLASFGGEYLDGRAVNPDAVPEHCGQIDMILEATGVAHLEFDLLSALGTDGIYVLTGIPGGDRPIDIDGPALMRRLVLQNQVMAGSVNASRAHFAAAVDDLQKATERWGDAISELITHRFPYDRFADAFSQHPADEIKAVVSWASVS